jgi:hypothetical protein
MPYRVKMPALRHIHLIGDLNASFDLYFAQYILSRWSEVHQPQLVKCLSV